MVAFKVFVIVFGFCVSLLVIPSSVSPNHEIQIGTIDILFYIKILGPSGIDSAERWIGQDW